MISAWWTLFAFIGGGCAGVLLIALMRVAADPVPLPVERCPIRSDGAVIGSPSLPCSSRLDEPAAELAARAEYAQTSTQAAGPSSLLAGSMVVAVAFALV
jgi:hypothetical protein